ncbi:ras-related protein Rab-12-like [Hydractinia symbiolongicarpus]|uniref:ras-related protein Rab-12-like n=1 Tax=Hydractinia symbiolongicarpus TaxID=13093 RepID=UPI00254D48D0|nr:ras-related protein Rab-12-like [Hydractinia symbiolongicarpus]
MVVIGSEGCGKTSILRRFAGDTFYEYKKNPDTCTFSTMMYFEVHNHTIEVYTNITELLMIKCNTTLQSANGYILVYEYGNEESFKYMWDKMIELKKRRKENVIILCNKFDQYNTWDSPKINGGLDTSIVLDYRHYFISAKTNRNIAKAFSDLAQKIISGF